MNSLTLFKLLADDTRLKIVLLTIDIGEVCVCELCEALALSQPKISRHLANLRAAGLLLDRREGKWVFYRLSDLLPDFAKCILDQSIVSESQNIHALKMRIINMQNKPEFRAFCPIISI